MTRYWRFWRAANVRPFRSLRSDYPLFFTSRNCLRQCRCAHIHRLLMSHGIAPSGARSEPTRLVLGLHWHKENHALCTQHGFSSGYLHRFVSPAAGPISLSTERKCSLTCTSRPKLSVCTAVCFDKRNVKYGALNRGFLVSQAAQHSCSVHRQISSTQCSFTYSRRLSRSPSCVKTKEEHYVSH
jgi:hypothetical protein